MVVLAQFIKIIRLSTFCTQPHPKLVAFTTYAVSGERVYL